MSACASMHVALREIASICEYKEKQTTSTTQGYGMYLKRHHPSFTINNNVDVLRSVARYICNIQNETHTKYRMHSPVQLQACIDSRHAQLTATTHTHDRHMQLMFRHVQCFKSTCAAKCVGLRATTTTTATTTRIRLVTFVCTPWGHTRGDL